MRYNYFSLFISLLRSIPFNIRQFSIKKGIHIPMLIAWNCKTSVPSKSIIIPDQVYFGMIKYGVNLGHFGRGNKDDCYLSIGRGGRLVFEGKCNIAVGSVVNISKGIVTIGDQVSTNDRFTLSSEKAITIGKGTLFGWNCMIIDGDGHCLINEENEIVNSPSEVHIGTECWIASDTKIMKGVHLADYTTVAMGAIVTKSVSDNSCIVAGNPAKVVKKGVRWVGREREHG